MALSWRWSPVRSTASVPCALNCCGEMRAGKGGQLCPEISRGGFQASCASSISTGCRSAFADRRTSTNTSFTRGIAPCTPRPHDDNHYQDSKAVVRTFASKDDFLPAVEIKEILAEDQATQKCVALHPWTQHQSAMQHSENDANDRYFRRCIHHLHAVVSLPRVIPIDKQPIFSQSEKLLVSKRGINMDLEGNKDGDNSSLMSRTSGSNKFYVQKPVMHLLNGYWFGPDHEDGWGFVEALLSPVDMGEPFCKR